MYLCIFIKMNINIIACRKMRIIAQFQIPNICVQFDNNHPNMEILMKNGELVPSTLQLTLQKNQSQTGTYQSELTIRIIKNQTSDTNVIGIRKYIFAIEELEEYETQFMEEGTQQSIKWITKPGTYHLFCVNYPKLKMKIVAKEPDEEKQIQEERERLSMNKISLNLQAVQEEREDKQEEQHNKLIQKLAEEKAPLKSQQLGPNPLLIQKNKNQWLEDEEINSESPFGTPRKAQIQDFDRILSSNKISEENLENRYLRYFQEQFKLWRNFFEGGEEASHSEEQSPERASFKEKPKSERRKNSDNNITEQRKEENWSKRQNFSPNQNFFTESCGSPSYNQNLSDKEKSVGSYLYSHQDNHDRGDEELYQKTRTMKKTNSEYRLAVEDLFQEKETLPDTEKKKSASKDNKCKNLTQWIDNWCENEGLTADREVKIADDRHLVNQWLIHLKNKYKLAKFICE